MKKHFYLPACPNCGKRLNYFQAFGLIRSKNIEEHVCSKCGKPCKIVPDNFLYGLALLVMAGVIASAFFKTLILRFYMMLALLLIFFVLFPFLIHLEEQKPEEAVKSAEPDKPDEPERLANPDETNGPDDPKHPE